VRASPAPRIGSPPNHGHSGGGGAGDTSWRRTIPAKEPARKIPRDVNEAARDLARGLMQTEGYRVSARQRKMIETGFADMKRNLGLTRLAKAIWPSPEPTTSPTMA
jgi:hypothetical protein